MTAHFNWVWNCGGEIMEAVQIFVEGAGDVLFIMHLLMTIEPALVGRWKKCPTGDEIDETQFQPPKLTMKAIWRERLLVIHSMNGVSNIFPMLEAALTSLCVDVGERDIHLVKNVFVVDADNSIRRNGTGGITAAKSKIANEINRCRALGIDCAGFAMPNDKSDGTLENLLEGMIPQSNRKVVDCCWRGFEVCTKANGAKYSPPLKSMIDVYAKLFNHDANQGIFASCSFKDKTVWDWSAPILDPLKKFLKAEVL